MDNLISINFMTPSLNILTEFSGLKSGYIVSNRGHVHQEMCFQTVGNNLLSVTKQTNQPENKPNVPEAAKWKNKLPLSFNGNSLQQYNGLWTQVMNTYTWQHLRNTWRGHSH